MLDRKREREQPTSIASNVHGTIDIIYSCKMLAERGRLVDILQHETRGTETAERHADEHLD